MGKTRGHKNVSQRGESAMNKARVTGFEDGYADPPLTAEEHEDEMAIYSPNVPFHERIEECIQRYRARRRLSSDRMNLFTKFLLLGGIDATQRQFTGTAKVSKDFKEDGFNVDEIRGMTANDTLGHGSGPVGRFYNPEYPEHWEVDFAGVVAGFLSDFLPGAFSLENDVVEIGVDCVLNFLKYVRHHDVCPEYEENLLEACAICEKAKVELPQCTAAAQSLPGNFNLAARVLLCGTGEVSSLASGLNKAEEDTIVYEERKDIAFEFDRTVFAPRDFNPDLVFKATIAIHNPEPDHMMAMATVNKDEFYVVRTYKGAFEARGTLLTTEDEKKAYAGIKGKDGYTGAVGCVGVLYVQPTMIEDGWDNNPTSLEGPNKTSDNAPFPLLVDEDVLDHIQAGIEPGSGTKLRLVICETNIRFKFIKEVIDVLPTFYTFLPQTLMLNYKVPKPNDRPAPSVEDPYAEDRQEENMLKDEDKRLEKELEKKQHEKSEAIEMKAT